MQSRPTFQNPKAPSTWWYLHSICCCLKPGHHSYVLTWLFQGSVEEIYCIGLSTCRFDTKHTPVGEPIANMGGGCGWVWSKTLCYGLWYPIKCVMEQKAENLFCTNLQDTTFHFHSESEPKAYDRRTCLFRQKWWKSTNLHSTLNLTAVGDTNIYANHSHSLNVKTSGIRRQQR